MKGLHNLVTLICPVCGREFHVWPAVAKRRKHCSHKCLSAHKSTMTGDRHPMFGRRHRADAKTIGNNWNKGKKREKSFNWKGGRNIRQGYVFLYFGLLPDREQELFASMRGRDGYIQEHRLVVARRLGRPLSRHEEVHHINGVKDDNRDRNLELLLDRKHRKEHWRVYAAAMELRRENDFLRSKLAEFIGESAYDIKPENTRRK